MKGKNNTPVFSAIVLRVLEVRFKEIVRVKLVSQTVFELVLKSRADAGAFLADFDGYMVHLVSEFGEIDQGYAFRIFQSARMIAELNYNELNNINEINVNLYPTTNHGN
jgi:hypothetical protein